MLAYINISYVDNIIKALRAYMHKGAKEKLKYIRKDIRLVFNNLTNNAKELLNVICILKIMLSKSRPSNFFKLKYSLKAFDYNFYIKDNMHCIAIFITYITSISVN
jgi:flagellar motor component MotA